MAANTFNVPRDGEIFIVGIRERCDSFIDAGIWSGITKADLRTWINQFDKGHESYFAACILDAIIYRTNEQTGALMEQLFQRNLPDLFRTNGLLKGMEEGVFDRLYRNNKNYDPGIRIVPVIKHEDPPTKSGPVIARMYKQQLSINEKWIIWPEKISEAKKNGIDTFLFVDDFLGTGTQFMSFARRFRIRDILSGCTTIYAPLAAHETGILNLRNLAKWLHICYVEHLSQRYSLFDNSSHFFNDGENSPQAARYFYTDFLRKKKLRISRDFVAGYGRLATTYVFQHATPNNNIPLLWYENERWKPLFRR